MTTTKVGLSLLAAILVVFAAYEVSGEAIDCYQCTGNSTSGCEKVSNGLKTVPCNGSCYTEYDDSEEWKRDCTESQCDSKQDGETWKVCCGKSECNIHETYENSAPLIGGATLLLLGSLLLTVIFSHGQELLG